MTLGSLFVSAVACMVLNQPLPACWQNHIQIQLPTKNAAVSDTPFFSGTSLDVIVSAKSYIAWDLKSNVVIKEKNADDERPIASLNKLMSLLVVRQLLSPDDVVIIPPDVRNAQRKGADIQLPVGEHVRVADLIAASLIPSANDAMVTLAVAAKGSEDAFVRYVNQYAQDHGFIHTQEANATGLDGGSQHATARDVKHMMTMAYADPLLRSYMNQGAGDLTTIEGSHRHFVSTDKLLGTYLPILAAKTGYTIQAGENLTIITQGPAGQQMGVVILGSQDRFYDTKVLVEWMWRNFTWPG